MSDSTLTSIQRKTLEYKDMAVIKYGAGKDFLHGKIPDMEDYKRLTVAPEKAIQIATYGYMTALKELGVKLFFTQALILGACVLGTHHKIYTIMPSQYGKSFVSACISLILASRGEEISIAANDQPLTDKIMDEIRKIVPNTPEHFKKKLTTPIDKFEKLQVSLSKNKIGFIGGGAIIALTLGGSYSNSKSNNKAVGQSGNFLIDECAFVPDANYAETGRSEVAYRKDGRPYVSIEMSNPHEINHFYRDMIQDPVEDGALIVWADLRTSIEEGKLVFKEQDPRKPTIESTKFFKNEDVCRSYYLSDFGSLINDSFFSTNPEVDDSPVDLSEGDFVLGLDSAGRGADAIMGTLMRLPEYDDDRLRVIETINFKPTVWNDFETPRDIVAMLVALCNKVNIRAIVMDIGGSDFLYQMLGKAIEENNLDVALKGIVFNNGVTAERVRAGHDISEGDSNGAELGINKRAEMYIDLRQAIEARQISFTQKVADIVQPEMNATGKEQFTGSGKIQLEGKATNIKKKLGHSPDTLDSVVMALQAYIWLILGLFDDSLISFYE